MPGKPATRTVKTKSSSSAPRWFMLIGGAGAVVTVMIGFSAWRAMDEAAETAFRAMEEPAPHASTYKPDQSEARKRTGGVAPERDWQSGYAIDGSGSSEVTSPAQPFAPAWQRHAAPMPKTGGRPMIAIVIDDMGLDRQRSLDVVNLPGPMTLSYLPYAENLQPQVDYAKRQGHEIMLHMPMEPKSKTIDPGPHALRSGYDQISLLQEIDWNLQRFTGYVGINNHMGSRFTENVTGMTTVMDVLQARGLLYLDSLTSPQSVGYRVARRADVPAAIRQVFLDHEDSSAFIARQLSETERVARRQGYAIAIGHPRARTVAALEEWLAGLDARGFIQVPVTTVIRALLHAEKRVSEIADQR